MLSGLELERYIDEHFTQTLFRLDALEFYNVPNAIEDFERYQSGHYEPDMERKRRWLDMLRDEAARGLRDCKVWTVRTPLADQARMACEWGYAYNVPAGEDVRIFDRSTQVWPELAVMDHDFYLIDDERVVRMHYDENAHFAGAEVLSKDAVPAYRATRDALWEIAVPFESWWAARPHEHRARQAF